MIENELKYVLRSEALGAALDQRVFGRGLRQGYLPGQARIRQDGATFMFTYKLPADDAVYEIEKEISGEEFERLWPYTSDRLEKIRFSVEDGDVHWDIDFFIRNDEDYFAMAEAEMPEDMREPPRILPWLEPYVVYSVPRERTIEFTSRSLANRDHAELLMKQLEVPLGS